MKRFISLLVVLSLVLSLSACSGFSLPGSSSKKATSGMLRTPDQPSTPDIPDYQSFYSEISGQFKTEAWEKASKAYSEYLIAVTAASDAYDSSALSPFYRRIMPLLLPSDQGNSVCSPLNVYLALAMLAEITGGCSRSQILAAMDAEDPDALARQVENIWIANYRNADSAKCLLSSSVWLKDGLSFNQNTLDRLSAVHRASAYSGTPGTEQMDRALRRWMNDATGDLLKDQIDTISFHKELISALVTAVYYKAPWEEGFSREVSYQGRFISSSGKTVTADYMFESRPGSIYAGSGFSAASKTLLDGSTMWFLLPGEGLSPADLLRDGAVTDLLYGSVSSDRYIVRLSVPRFDVSAQTDLLPVLTSLGITDVTDPSLSDFSPLIDGSREIALSSADHGARLLLNEDGIEAAAYTIIVADGGSALIDPLEEYDFILDRPFVFALTSQAGDLLFVGTVADPTA